MYSTMPEVVKRFDNSWVMTFPVPGKKPVTFPTVQEADQEKVVPGRLAVSRILVEVPEQIVCARGVVVITGGGDRDNTAVSRLMQPFESLRVTMYSAAVPVV